jgi:hypothetical protein
MSASTLTVPTSASSASDITQVGTTYRRVVPLPSSACVIDASCAHDIGASCTYDVCIFSASCANYPTTSGSWCATFRCRELRGVRYGHPCSLPMTPPGTSVEVSPDA